MQEWLANNWVGILLGLGSIIGGVFGWIITNWIGRPIIDVRDRRIKAIQAAEQNARVGLGAGDGRIREARAALSEAASGLRSISRGHGWPLRSIRERMLPGGERPGSEQLVLDRPLLADCAVGQRGQPQHHDRRDTDDTTAIHASLSRC
jgi:hypothetical protein